MNQTGETRMTRAEAAKFFAVEFNKEVWALLETPSRTADQTRRMLDAAHASNAHWVDVGGPVNRQRGAWLLSRAYAEAGFASKAIEFADVCQRLHDAHKGEMQEFDSFYALEAEARAHAVAGDLVKAGALREKARAAAEQIPGDEDRKLALADLDAGHWGELDLKA